MVYGIDLGTTYSCIAQCDDNGLVEVIHDRQYTNEAIIPSVIYFDATTGAPNVGNDAKSRLGTQLDTNRIIQHAKRSMGEDFCPGEIQIGSENRFVSPVEGSAIILHHLLKNANSVRYGRGEDPVNDAVITIPAGFNNKQRECTKIAAELAGINVLGLIHEPTAAAVACSTKPGDVVLVFDLGGGTLDVSIVKCSTRNGRLFYETLGVSSDREVHNRYLGGKDWDDEIVNFAAGELGYDLSTMERHDKNAMMLEAERCKKGLSGQSKSSIFYIERSKQLNLRRTDFENITVQLLDLCVDVVNRAIENAERIQGTDNITIDRFLLVGGSSNMPMIRTRLSQIFERRFGRGRNRDQWIIVTDPEMSIAKGAAKYAHALQQGAVEEENILIGTELSQFSYGTKVIGRDDGKLYLQNLVLSSDDMVVESRDFPFITSVDGQNGVGVDVYENRSVEDCVLLDNSHKLIYDGIYKFDHPVPKGIQINFSVSRDKDGIISIRVKSEGHHEEFHTVGTVHPPISEEVRQQIIQSIRLMDEE